MANVNHCSLPYNTSFSAYNIDSKGGATSTKTLNDSLTNDSLTVKITLRRFPQFYVINIAIPVFVLTIVGQSSFAIPEHADAKLLVPVSRLLVHSIDHCYCIPTCRADAVSIAIPLPVWCLVVLQLFFVQR